MLRAFAAIVASLIPTLSGPTSSSSDLAWGPPSEGLQLALTVDCKNAEIHVWLRNATDQPVYYNDYRRGYFEAVRLEYRREANWVPLERQRDASRLYEDAGPTQLNEQVLRPRATIPFFIDWPDDYVWPADALMHPTLTIRLRQELNEHQAAKRYEIGAGPLFFLYSGPVAIDSVQLRDGMAKGATDIKVGRGSHLF